MKKTLGQLSRAFHKEGRSQDEILPQLREIFDQIKSDPPNDIQKCLEMVINMATPELVAEIYEWAALKHSAPNLSEQICTAQVRVMAQRGDIDQALNLIDEMSTVRPPVRPHVRTFVPVVAADNGLTLGQYMRTMELIRTNGIIPTANLFSLLIRSAPRDLTRDTFTGLIEWAAQHCNLLDQWLAQSRYMINPVIIKHTNSVCPECQDRLQILTLSPAQRKLMLESVFETGTNPSIVRWVQTRGYNIVIDGANVAHYNNSPFDLRKVVTMINKINNGFPDRRILLVFSMCRKKATKYLIQKWTNVDVFYTKAGTNDDLSWLYVGLYFPQVWCITNDQMRDHVYYRFTEAVGRNVIDIWMERNIVSFHFDITRERKGHFNVQMSLDIPLDYSVRPQWNGNRVHVPVGPDMWCCATMVPKI